MTDERKGPRGGKPPAARGRGDREPAKGKPRGKDGGGPPRPRDGAAKPEARPAFSPRPRRDAPSAAPRKAGEEPRPGRREREAVPPVSGGEERIARRLARAGIASRRDAEAMIAAGRVSVNGRVLDTPALNVGSGDRIEVDGQPIPEIERTRLFLFHKPSGLVTTSRDPEGRRTVFDVLPKDLPRLVTVGRLDINTEGLLLMTNDGGLARLLELPSTGWLRRYRVRVHGAVDEARLAELADGIAVDGVFYGSIEAALDRVQGANAWLTMGLREGKNREVKNVLRALGLDVTRLIRVSYGPFQLGELAEGEVRELKGRHLRDQLGERLIAESGADFDAPLRPLAAPAPKPKARDDERPSTGHGPRPRGREDRREAALGRLSTTKPRQGGGRSDGKPSKGAAEGDKPAGSRSRTANVWMAPGARPLGEKGLAEREARGEGRRYAGKPKPNPGPGAPRGRAGAEARPGRPRDGKPQGGKPQGGRPQGGGPPRGKGGPTGRGGK